jgi:hypothetical protein
VGICIHACGGVEVGVKLDVIVKDYTWAAKEANNQIKQLYREAERYLYQQYRIIP